MKTNIEQMIEFNGKSLSLPDINTMPEHHRYQYIIKNNGKCKVYVDSNCRDCICMEGCKKNYDDFRHFPSRTVRNFKTIINYRIEKCKEWLFEYKMKKVKKLIK